MPVSPAAALAIHMARGILSMGWAAWSVDHVSNPTLGVHPLARSRCQGLVLGIVNPNATKLGRFGTVPRIPSSAIDHRHIGHPGTSRLRGHVNPPGEER